MPPLVRPLKTLSQILLLICAGSTGARSAAVPPESATDPVLEGQKMEAKAAYEQKIVPFLNAYCVSCHGPKKRKGNITFQYALKAPGSSDFRKLWLDSLANVRASDMPPEDADKKPSNEERTAFVEAVTALKYLSPKDPGTFAPRRLNRVEYANTLRDLLNIAPSAASTLPEEVPGEGFINSISPLLMEKYLSITHEVLEEAIAPEGSPPTAAQVRIFGPGGGSALESREKASGIIRSLARSVYRRPASDEETAVLMQVYDLGAENRLSPAQSLRLVLKAALISPQFLFITPRTDLDAAGAVVPLDEHQLASRLSYFLWATMPDAELSDLADSGKLRLPGVFEKQVTRMLQDPRSRALFDGFGAQWLGLSRLADKNFDPIKFPMITPALRDSMVDEARMLFAEVLREDQSLLKLIDNDHTFVNGPLATLYGLEPQKPPLGESMRRVVLNSPDRGGVLTMPGFLAATSMPNRTSPVNRGVWVLEQILGEHVPPAPPNVPSLEKQDKTQVSHLTLRQRTEMHRSNPVCANCHRILDPIGFGLENFDAIGRWRDRDDSGAAIDASGEMPGGQRFGSPRELKALLTARSDDICRALSAKILAFALGRTLEGYDEVVADQIARQVAADGYRMQTLVKAVVTSYPFTHRRTQPLPPP